MGCGPEPDWTVGVQTVTPPQQEVLRGGVNYGGGRGGQLADLKSGNGMMSEEVTLKWQLQEKSPENVKGSHLNPGDIKRSTVLTRNQNYFLISKSTGSQCTLSTLVNLPNLRGCVQVPRVVVVWGLLGLRFRFLRHEHLRRQDWLSMRVLSLTSPVPLGAAGAVCIPASSSVNGDDHNNKDDGRETPRIQQEHSDSRRGPTLQGACAFRHPCPSGQPSAQR